MIFTMFVRLHVSLMVIKCGIILAQFKYQDPCENHLGFTAEEANAIMENWPANLAVSKVNRTHKCLVACLVSYFMLLDNSGEIHLDKYFDAGIIDEFEVAGTLVRCFEEYKNEKDICDYAFGMFNCYRMEKIINSESSQEEY
uniref:Odorant-binding protein 57d n=1 Tax=Drosophila merina TaxID=300357 RepID=B0M2C5_9MUSC|nr:odorant-binding protein 57d [Drosophila merina]